MQFLIDEDGKGIQHFSDIYHLGLFEHEDIIRIMGSNGLSVSILEEGLIGRKVFLGVKN